MSMLRHAQVTIKTIKEVYDFNHTQDIISFNARYAKKCKAFVDVSSLKENSEVTASKNETASKVVISIKPKAGYLYMVTSGLHGDVSNDNGDYFPWDELTKVTSKGKPMFESWIGCPVLLNHDMHKRVGTIIDAFNIDDEKSIDFLLEVEEKKAPTVVQGIRNGSVTGTSMGVMVGESICSLCENVAHDEKEWCEHLSPMGFNLKGKTYQGQDGNKFKDKVGNKVEEINYKLEGVEDSIITLGEPADGEALIKKVLASKTENEETPMARDRGEFVAGDAMEQTEYSGKFHTQTGASLRSEDLVAQVMAQVKAQDAANKRGGPSVLGNVANTLPEDFTAANIVKAIKEGKIKPVEAITHALTLNLITAKQAEDLTPKMAIAILEEEANEAALETEANKETTMPKTAQKVAPNSGVKSGNQASDTNKAKTSDSKVSAEENKNLEGGLENQGNEVKDGGDQALTSSDAKTNTTIPKAKSEPINKSSGGSGTQSKETQKAKTQEKSPEPKQPTTVAEKQLEALKLQMAALEAKIAQTKNSDIPKTPNGSQASETNSARTQDKKPAAKAEPINKSSGGSGNQAIGSGDVETGSKAGKIVNKAQIGNDMGLANTEDTPIDHVEAPELDETPVAPTEETTDENVEVSDIVMQLQDLVSKLSDKVGGDVSAQATDIGGEASASVAFEGGPEESNELGSEDNGEVESHGFGSKEDKEVGSFGSDKETGSKDTGSKPEKGVGSKKKDKEVGSVGSEKEEKNPVEAHAKKYSVEFIPDPVSMADSYYVAKFENKPVFTISGRQAYASADPKDIKVFCSKEYKENLLGSLKDLGAKEVYDLFGGLGVVVAQAVPGAEGKDALPGGPPAQDAGLGANPTEPQAGPAQVTPEAQQTIGEDPEAKSPISDDLVDWLTTYLTSTDDTKDVDTACQELATLVAGEGASCNEEFKGRVQESVDKSKTEKAVGSAPDEYKEDVANDMNKGGGENPPPTPAPSPAGGAPEATPHPAMAVKIPKRFSDLVKAYKSNSDTLNTVKAGLKTVASKVKNVIAENDSLKAEIAKRDADEYIKARTTATMKLAEKKAEVGIIEKSEIKTEAVRLAKLSDSEVKAEIKNVENTIKVASKISEKNSENIKNSEKKLDYTSRGEGLGKMLGSIPTPEIVDAPKTSPFRRAILDEGK